jgi:hypothetical protein
MKNAIFVSYLLSFIDLISNMNNNEITQLWILPSYYSLLDLSISTTQLKYSAVRL